MNEISNLFSIIIEKISIYTKEGLENLTSFMLVVFSLLFIHIYIVDINILANYLGILFYPLIFMILYLIKINLFSYDFLLFGSEEDKYVKAFKYKLPSKFIFENYDVTQEEAIYYWYKIFNSWQKEDHEKYGQFIRTYERGYACRFVFYSIKLFKFLSIVSLSLFILLNAYYMYIKNKICVYPDGYHMFGFIFVIILLDIMLIKLNNSDINNLSGVWEKFEEINNDHISWLKNNIKDKNDLIKYEV